jgi:hypothetical protein
MRTLYRLWISFFDICRLHSKPQDLPASNVLLGFTLFFYAAVGGASLLMQYPVIDALLLTIVDTGLLVILTSSLLYITHFSSRIKQTLAAVAGTNVVLGILSLPLVFWLAFYEGDMSLPVLLFWGLMAWGFVIYTHILHHALEIEFFLCSLLTLVIYLLTYSILIQMIPLAK